MKRALGLAFVVLCAIAAAPVRAEGTARIMQPDGTLEIYRNVAIKILHSSLYVTSQDGEGTIVITRAACSYQGRIMVCLPTGATLVQSGSARPLDLTTGTVYLNMTDKNQQLPLSSQSLPARSVMLSLSTKRGTYVGLTGRIDSVTK